MTTPRTLTYAPHTLIAFGGNINGGPPGGDVWQCGIRVAEGTVAPDGSTEGAPLSTPVSYMNDLQATLRTWFTTAVTGVGCSGGATLAWLKVNNIGADGKYSNKSVTNRYDYANPGAGPVTAAGQCPMITLAYTFTSLRARGPGSKGRIYLPLNLPAQYSSTLSTVANYVTHAKNLLAAIQRPVGAASNANGVFPIIASGRNAQNFQINGVRVGNVMDVQRRRKNAIAETYTSSVYP